MPSNGTRKLRSSSGFPISPRRMRGRHHGKSDTGVKGWDRTQRLHTVAETAREIEPPDRTSETSAFLLPSAQDSAIQALDRGGRNLPHSYLTAGDTMLIQARAGVWNR